MTVNMSLLRKAVKWAEHEDTLPEAERTWFQADWFVPGKAINRNCGTAYCIAGYVALQNGYVPDGGSMVRNPKTGEDGVVEDVAEGLLGITSSQAAWLFAGHNTLEDIQILASDIAAEAGETL